MMFPMLFQLLFSVQHVPKKAVILDGKYILNWLRKCNLEFNPSLDVE